MGADPRGWLYRHHTEINRLADRMEAADQEPTDQTDRDDR